jgi:pantetheine-phosphate adenylyltransferase
MTKGNAKAKRAIYPGTFDPITAGHTDIVRRASSIFDEVVIAVAESRSKKPLFGLDFRLEMAEAVAEEYGNVTVTAFDDLLVNLCGRLEADIVIRGLRAVSDFEYELQMGYANSSLRKELETIYLMPSLEYAFISSSVVRSILEHGGRVDHLLPSRVHEMIMERL